MTANPRPTPSPAFSAKFQVTWGDLDANRHLRNTAYFDYAAQTRFLYLSGRGFGPSAFAKHGLGPAVVTETITYYRELGFLEDFTVEFLLGGINPAGSKFVGVNRFQGADEEIRAELRSLVVWLDLATRKAISPPDILNNAIAELVRTDDYRALE